MGLALLGALGGCDSSPTLNGQEALREAAAPCSVRFELLVTWPSEGKAERYAVHRGIFGWSGGAAALQGRATWEAALTAEACASLESAIATLCKDLPRSEPRDAQQDQFDLNVWCGEASHRIMAPWPDTRLGSLPAVLEALSAARLDSALEKLPVAGQRLQ